MTGHLQVCFRLKYTNQRSARIVQEVIKYQLTLFPMLLAVCLSRSYTNGVGSDWAAHFLLSNNIGDFARVERVAWPVNMTDM